MCTLRTTESFGKNLWLWCSFSYRLCSIVKPLIFAYRLFVGYLILGFIGPHFQNLAAAKFAQVYPQIQQRGWEVSRHTFVLRRSRCAFLVSWSWTLMSWSWEKCSALQLPVLCSLLNVTYITYRQSVLLFFPVLNFGEIGLPYHFPIPISWSCKNVIFIGCLGIGVGPWCRVGRFKSMRFFIWIFIKISSDLMISLTNEKL